LVSSSFYDFDGQFFWLSGNTTEIGNRSHVISHVVYDHETTILQNQHLYQLVSPKFSLPIAAFTHLLIAFLIMSKDWLLPASNLCFSSYLAVMSIRDAIEAVERTSSSRVVLPDSKEYDEIIESYFSELERELKPACFLTPRSSLEVAEIVKAVKPFKSLKGKVAICGAG